MFVIRENIYAHPVYIYVLSSKMQIKLISTTKFENVYQHYNSFS